MFNIDLLFGVTLPDVHTLKPSAYSIPTLVAYGSKDVMTAQVEGVEAIVDMALRAGNHDVSIRGYPVANHVLRLGDESETGTPFGTSTPLTWWIGRSARRRSLRQLI